jgi:acyl-CoA synthetase (AMP-forming)/AMP-acid ligase II
MGLRQGERVSLHLPTRPAFVIALLGTVRAGGIPCL